MDQKVKEALAVVHRMAINLSSYIDADILLEAHKTLSEHLENEPDEKEAMMVCLETYQAASIMMSDLDIWYSDRAQNLLTNLSLGKRIHKDLLPWPSVK